MNIPLIPRLAKGGIIDEATLALVGEGKSPEAVVPLDKLPYYIAEAMKDVHSGGNTLNIYTQELDSDKLDQIVRYVNKEFGIAY